MTHELQRLEIKLQKAFLRCPANCPGGCLQTRPGTCAILKSEICGGRKTWGRGPDVIVTRTMVESGIGDRIPGRNN